MQTAITYRNLYYQDERWTPLDKNYKRSISYFFKLRLGSRLICGDLTVGSDIIKK